MPSKNGALKSLRVAQLAEKITRARKRAGVSVEDLLVGLKEERKRLYSERYGAKKTTSR